MKTVILNIALALAFAGACATGVRGQEAESYARAKAALPASAAAQFEHTVRASREQGLPVDALIAKVLEGQAKRVPADRILVAVRQLADELARANTLLRADAGPGRASAVTGAEIEAVADALQRGVPGDAVRSLHRNMRAGESLALSVHTLADLLDRGVPLAIGLDVIGAWRGRGAEPRKLVEIPAAVERLVRQGVLPAQAGAAVAAGVRAGRGLGTLGPADAGVKIGAGRGKKK